MLVDMVLGLNSFVPKDPNLILTWRSISLWTLGVIHVGVYVTWRIASPGSVSSQSKLLVSSLSSLSRGA